MLIQIILVVFLLFAVSRVLMQLKSGNLTATSFLFWSGLFAVAIIGVLSPKATGEVARLLGIGRGADVVVYVSIVLLFYLTFRISVTIEDIRHEITRLVREIALSKEQKAREKR